MTFRRSLSLYRYFTGDLFMTDIVAESVALIISLLFLLGILYATRIIESEMRTRNEKEGAHRGAEERLGGDQDPKGHHSYLLVVQEDPR